MNCLSLKKYKWITLAVWLYVILIISVSAQNIKEQSYTKTTPLDIELAFSMKSLAHYEEPAVHPNGEYIAYSIFQQPIKSISSRYTLQPRYLPNGTPASKVGSSIFIVDVKTGKEKQVGHKSGNSWRPSWSPDGNQFVFYSDSAGYPQLWIYDIRSSKKTRPTEIKIKSKTWLGDEAKWSPDGQLVYVPVDLNWNSDLLQNETTETDPLEVTAKVYRTGNEIEEEKDPTFERNEFYINENNASLASINVKTGEVKILVRAEEMPRPSFLRLSNSGKWLTYLSVYQTKNITESKTYFDLVVLPTAGGKAKIMASDLNVPGSSRKFYIETYRWHPTQDKLVYVKDNILWLVDFTKGSEVNPVRISKDVEEVQANPLLYTPDGKEVLVRVQGSNELAFIPLSGGKAKLFSTGKEYSYRDVIKSDENTLWSPKEGYIAIQTAKGNNQGAIMYLNTKNGSTEIVYTYESNNTFITAMPDKKSILSTIEDAYTPIDLYLIDTKSYQEKQLTEINPGLKNVRFGDIEEFETEIVRYDGVRTKVKTAVLLPLGKKRGEKLPAVCFFYPGSNYSQLSTEYGGGKAASFPGTQLFSTRGYAAILLDVPLSPRGKGSNPVHDMTNAVLPQVYHAAELGYIDIGRVAIMGQSYGGYSTASIITETNLFRAAVAISGLYDFIGIYGLIRDDGLDYISLFETGQLRMGTSPFSDLQRYIRNSPYLQVEKITTPLLMLHGKNDYACDFRDAQRMFVAMKRLDKTAQLAVYEGEGHVPCEWSLANGVDAVNRILNFLDKYLTE
ncbi:MAG: prolyl oligopeptidase family serine peptidase [Ignavibacteria bacterium]